MHLHFPQAAKPTSAMLQARYFGISPKLAFVAACIVPANQHFSAGQLNPKAQSS